MASPRRKVFDEIETKVVAQVKIGDAVSARIIEDSFKGDEVSSKRNRPDQFWLAETVERHRVKKEWTADQIISFEGKVTRK